jgi:hypothetical protein
VLEYGFSNLGDSVFLMRIYREIGEELRLFIMYSFRVKISISSELLLNSGRDFFGFLRDVISSRVFTLEVVLLLLISRGDSCIPETNELRDVEEEWEEFSGEIFLLSSMCCDVGEFYVYDCISAHSVLGEYRSFS